MTLAFFAAVSLLAPTSPGCVLDRWQPPVDACAGPRCASQDAAAEGGAGACADRSVIDLRCGYGSFACAIRCDGTVWCWGANSNGELGDGTTVSRSTPVRTLALDGPATALAAGYHHACAIVTGGRVWCWGNNTEGQLGDGTRVDRSTAAPVAGLPAAATVIAAGGLHTCAGLADGSLWCWGHNRYGALGDGTTTSHIRPAVVATTEPVTQLTAGQYHSCARFESSVVQCWGFNGFGALGVGGTQSNPTPVDVALTDIATAIDSVANHGCAVAANGVVFCWGYNEFGQLGDGSLTMRTTPVQARGLPSPARRVAVGGRHSCAVLETGALHCWGANEVGQLGDGTTIVTRATASVPAQTGPAVARACASDTVTCAALRDGRVQCWGANDEGQIGDGTFAPRHTPTAVLLPP